MRKFVAKEKKSKGKMEIKKSKTKMPTRKKNCSVKI